MTGRYSVRSLFHLFFCVMLHFNLQNIEDGKTYNLVMYVKAPEATDLTVSLTSSNGQQNLASATITLVSFLSVHGPEDIYLLTFVERITLLQGCWHLELDKGGAEVGRSRNQ
jgi:hypothetical protein